MTPKRYEYAASARHIFADRKDSNSNGSQFQKTLTSTKIYTRLSGTFTVLRQNLNLLRPSHRTGPTKIDLKTLKEKAHNFKYYEMNVSAKKKHGEFWSNVPDRWGIN